MSFNERKFYALIDVVGQLRGPAQEVLDQIKLLQERLKPYQAKVKQLQEMVDELDYYDDDEEFVECGNAYKVEAGARERTRSVKSLVRLKEYLGDDVFYSIAKVPLGQIDQYVAPVDQQRYDLIQVDRTTRRIKVKPLVSD